MINARRLPDQHWPAARQITSAIDAYQRDFELIVARDCIGSYDPEYHAITLRYLDGKIARVLPNAEIANEW